MKNKTILAWHFAPTKARTRYSDEEIREGVTLTESRPLKLCRVGLHASVSLRDALRYAPGPVLSRVELSGEIVESDDKLCASKRKHVKVVDVTSQLREFAIWCAERVLPIWEQRYPDDKRPRECLETARRYLEGKATLKELQEARQAAAAAAYAYADAVAAYAARKKEREAQNEKLTALIEPLFT